MKLFLAAALGALSLLNVANLSAQDAPLPIPDQKVLPKDMKLDPALPTLFIVSDSTARNGLDLGWGDHFQKYFDSSKINVANRAVAGRSSRTYYNEGKWDAVLAEMKAGDFVLIQMGHNDGGSSADTITKDPKARGSIKGIGNETAQLPLAKPYETGPLAGLKVETIHTYGWYIRKYIADTRAKGATPILLTLTVRNIWKDGQVERDMGLKDVETRLSVEQKVPLADMASFESAYLQKLGPDKTAALFPIDHTHTSPAGAELNAQWVVLALKKIGSPVTAYLAP